MSKEAASPLFYDGLLDPVGPMGRLICTTYPMEGNEGDHNAQWKPQACARNAGSILEIEPIRLGLANF